MSRSQGFTLIEVLLAMAITAFVAVIAYSGLNVTITASERHQLQAEQQAALQLSLSILERDLRQLVSRGITDEYGDQQPALLAGSQQDYVMQLTRHSWDNPLALRRSQLQRVRYQLQDGSLWREYWLVLDRIDGDEGLQRVELFSGVEGLELRFLDGRSQDAAQSDLGGEWVDDWPLGERDHDDLPLAIELELNLEELGRIRRVIEIALGK